MTIGSILLGIALLVLAGLFVVRPFFRPAEQAVVPSERQELLEEKEALLDQLQALDFDHETGKIPAELHSYQRAQLVEQATAVMKALDSDDPHPSSAVAADIDIEIEAAIARLRQQQSPASTVSPNNGQARFCSQCGSSTDPDDKFCAHCGANLTLTPTTKTA